MFNVALLGLGKAGRFHLKSILRSDRCKLRYVLETGDSIARAREVLSKVRSLDLEGTTRLVDKYEDVLSDPGVDAVVVATPTSTHEAYVRQALRAGKPVLCEKPLAETAESVRSCYDEAVRCGLPLHCGFNRRFDPDFSRVYRQLKDGLVGKPHLIKLTSRDGEFHDLSYFQHSGSASIFKDSCVHEIDQLHWMVGEGPTEVYAQGYAHHPKIKEMGDVDTAIAVLKFPSGVLATIDNGRFSAYGHDQRLEIHGDRGLLRVDNPPVDSVELRYERGSLTTKTYDNFSTRYAEAYWRELEHFLDTVEDPSKPALVKVEEVISTMQTVEACEQSLKEGKVVRLQ